MYLPVSMLGQSGCRLKFPSATIYLDPYLSNSVQELDAPDLERLVNIVITPEAVTDADYVLITHEHIDHCDPKTLPIIASSSPQCVFIGPSPVKRRLLEWGIPENRIRLAEESWQDLNGGVRLHAVPAAHPKIEREDNGHLACVGYVLEFEEAKIYLAGDTSADQEVIDSLNLLGAIHTAFLPVNERNFFRDRRGIVGNMSVREAFQFCKEIGARQMVAVHWDMFSVNSVDPDEIRLLHQKIKPGFDLLLNPERINLGKAKVSIVIRTLNEAKYLDQLLTAIADQHCVDINPEVVLVDSGSNDGTLEIAERHGCRIFHIKREDFSFGRSLNQGCEAAEGEILVITSGHCVPVDKYWLQRLCQPILDGASVYTYGRQFGGTQNHFSECRIFAKYYPEDSKIPQDGFFCNNANSALLRSAWQGQRFDEELTGLEDMELAQWLVRGGGKVAYVADAAVYHYHDETWAQVRRRFEREAIALQKIMPQLHVSIIDTARYIFSSVVKDWRAAQCQKTHKPTFKSIFLYRWNQYIGSWKGNHEHRKLSHAEKEKYFYPH